MRLFYPDDTPDDEPVVDHGGQLPSMDPSATTPRACVICGKPSPNGPECEACDEREFRRWGR